jgi:hypothetical protein
MDGPHKAGHDEWGDPVWYSSGWINSAEIVKLIEDWENNADALAISSG